MIKLLDILSEVLNEDRCQRIADRKYDKNSAYKSGAIVRCRDGKIWKDLKEDEVDEEWSKSYKKSIDCSDPKGFSQEAHCAGRKKRQAGKDTESKSPFKEEVEEAKKTDYSKEKSQGLHGWFKRQGAPGKTGGWVDCNTCRRDKETGRKKCKPCGRQKGEKRAKYPSCKPTPASCSAPGKGEKWGKTKE
jgi:hypothetical protein